MPSGTRSARALLRDGDTILFIDRKARQYLRTVHAGRSLNVRGARFAADELIGLPEGSVLRSSLGEYLQIFRPTYAQLIPNLPREAQVIYPKDVGTILVWGDIHPGAHVVEVGVGPGATTIALLRAVGPTGEVVTYEIRDTFAAMARENVTRFYGDAPHWRLVSGDAYEGIHERDVDRFVVDVPEPWRVVPHAAGALRPGGVFVGFIPTVLQMQQLVAALRDGGFAAIEAMESLQRFWHVTDRSVRPEHRMVAHSGFLVVARRLAPPRTPHADDVPTDAPRTTPTFAE
ncbi:MAG: tRNA (adenine-N1)-methyltransferase [Deltaproteobacteria bacterium]|nr:tRNA (adenine-N1)-methyltransferase [Deltaproteobacteria bacterium]